MRCRFARLPSLAAEMSIDALTVVRGWVLPQQMDERNRPHAFVSIFKCSQERERLVAVGGGKGN